MPKHDSLESDMATCEVEAGGWFWFYYILKCPINYPWLIQIVGLRVFLEIYQSYLKDFEINRSMSQLFFFQFQKWMVAIYVSICNFSCSMSQLILFYGSRNVLLLGISINNCRSGSVPGYFQKKLEWNILTSDYFMSQLFFFWF